MFFELHHDAIHHGMCLTVKAGLKRCLRIDLITQQFVHNLRLTRKSTYEFYAAPSGSACLWNQQLFGLHETYYSCSFQRVIDDIRWGTTRCIRLFTLQAVLCKGHTTSRHGSAHTPSPVLRRICDSPFWRKQNCGVRRAKAQPGQCCRC